MKQVLLTVGVLLALGGSTAWAAESGERKKKVKEAKICKMVKIPGNRTKTKLCKPQSFWDEQMRIEKNARK